MDRSVWRRVALFAGACAILSLFAGCGPQKAPAQTPAVSVSPAASPAASPTAPGPVETEPAAQEQTATLYIGTKAGGFAEYPLAYEGELTPELLIQGIADLTGWDLTLAEPVASGKGGMSVCLSDTSALFAGPPEPQKDEFHMFSAEQLAETILDSIQRTLQKGFVIEPGDPDALDIYYFMEGEKPLELPEIGRSWSLEEPYQWAAE